MSELKTKRWSVYVPCQYHEHYIGIEAETAEEAIQKFKLNPQNYTCIGESTIAGDPFEYQAKESARKDLNQ